MTQIPKIEGMNFQLLFRSGLRGRNRDFSKNLRNLQKLRLNLFCLLFQPRHQLDKIAWSMPRIQLPYKDVIPRILHRARAARQSK